MSEVAPTQSIKFLDLTLPKVAAAEAVEIARREFGLSGSAKKLYSERDANFHIRPADGGAGHVLKIANAAEDPEVVDLQTACLRHIAAADPHLPVPRVVPARDGQAIAWVTLGNGARHMARVYSFLPGETLEKMLHKPELLADLGRFAGRLDRALAEFTHPAAAQEIPWDLRHLPRMAASVADIDGADRRKMVAGVIERFAAEAMPMLSRLRSQVIHNDLNLHNVLVEPDGGDRVAGVIDFGDIVVGPLVFEPAIAAADLWIGKDDPLGAVTAVIGAYNSVLPLTDDDIGVLYDLLLARHAISVVICARRAKHGAEEPSYLESYYEPCMVSLDQILTMGRARVTAGIRAACGQKS